MLAVAGLVKRYGNLTAVAGLDFEVAAGEIMALVGPNGAGKTTTLLCLAGLLRPDAGQIQLDGRTLGPERGRQLALIPETPEVYSMLTVWEHLVFVARSCRLGPGWEERGRELLQRLAIADRHDVLGEALSKGMRQKLLIASAVLAETPVLLLDEPMIGLDPRGQRELREILLEVRAQGRVVIISTHLLEYIEGLCDSLLIVRSGRVMTSGRVSDLVRQAAGRSLEDMFLEIVEAP